MLQAVISVHAQMFGALHYNKYYFAGVTNPNVEPEQSRQKEVTSVCQESVVDEINVEPIERVDTSVFPVAQPVIDLESKDPLGDIPSFENVGELGAAAACNTTPVVAPGKFFVCLCIEYCTGCI